MALFSWLAKGRAVRTARGVPVGPGVEAPPTEARRAPAPPPAPRPVQAQESRPDAGAARAKASGGGPTALLTVPVGARVPGGTAGKRGAAGGVAERRAEAPGAASGGEVIELPLSKVLASVPLLFLAGDAEAMVASEEVRKSNVALPLARVLGQLPSGRIEFSFDELRPQIPQEYLSKEADAAGRGEVMVSLDLSEVVSRVPASRLARRGDQLDVAGEPGRTPGNLIPMPFRPGVAGPLPETERLAKAVGTRSMIGEAPAVGGVPAEPLAEGPAREVVMPGAGAPRVTEVVPPRMTPPPGGMRQKASVAVPRGPDAAERAGRVEKLRTMPRARATVASALAPGGISRRTRPVPLAPDADEKTLAARALARWLGCAPDRPILIREIPLMLSRMPGVAGAILSDNEALTVARELPAGLSEDAVSSSASVLFKRLRNAARELGGGFTNQTLVGLGQWTLLITYELPFFLTTLHTSHQLEPRLDRRVRKVARALARLEAARPGV